MPDCIYREAAIEAVKKEREYTGKFTFEEEPAWAVGFQQGITFALSDIAVLPAADVRPVVMCKDCKHSDPWYSDKSRCFLWHEDGIDVFNDGFCNYGEKREEN